MLANESKSLITTIQFIVTENRTSSFLPKDREKSLADRKFGKILGLLYPLGFIGGILYCILTLWRREPLSLFRNTLIEDHASRVVYNALRRTWGDSVDTEVVTAVSSRKGRLGCFFRYLPAIRQAYEAAGISHVTEFIRVFRIFHFYLIWQGWFEENPPEAVLLARTNDQKRLALGAVAEEHGIPVYAFTVDRVALRAPAPFAVKAQLCWTARQAALSEERGVPGFRMPVPLVHAMKLPVPLPDDRGGQVRYGLLLNAKCYPDKVADWVKALTERHGIPELLVRPHPGYAVEKLSGLSHSVLCDWRQPLGEYLDSLDLVFALNTNALIDALLHGIPAVYVSGLDPYEHDLHRYVSDGLTFTYPPESDFFSRVNDFFSADAFRTKWNPTEFTSDAGEERGLMKSIPGSQS